MSDWLIYDADGKWVGIGAGTFVAAVYFLAAAVVYRLAPRWLTRLGMDWETDRPDRIGALLAAHLLLMVLLPLIPAGIVAVGVLYLGAVLLQ